MFAGEFGWQCDDNDDHLCVSGQDERKRDSVDAHVRTASEDHQKQREGQCGTVGRLLEETVYQ